MRQRDRRFRNTAHQDAQEFLNFTLDTLVEVVQKIQQRRTQDNAPCQSEPVHRNGLAADEGAVERDMQGATAPVLGGRDYTGDSPARPAQGDSGGSIRKEQAPAEQKSFVHDIFCGKTVTHTRCMNCEAQSKREENFMELTLDVEQQDTTLEQCMLAFRCGCRNPGLFTSVLDPAGPFVPVHAVAACCQLVPAVFTTQERCPVVYNKAATLYELLV